MEAYTDDAVAIPARIAKLFETHALVHPLQGKQSVSALFRTNASNAQYPLTYVSTLPIDLKSPHTTPTILGINGSLYSTDVYV